MPGFDKSSYDKDYIKKKRKMYGWNLSIEEYQAFGDYCEELGYDRSLFLKLLVNEHAQRRNLPPIFKAPPLVKSPTGTGYYYPHSTAVRKDPDIEINGKRYRCARIEDTQE